MSKQPVNHKLAQLLYTCSNDLTDRTAMLVAADWCQENGETKLEWLLRYLPQWDAPLPMLFTGSRQYGTPKPESDFDWVINCGRKCRQVMIDHSELDPNGYKYDDAKYPGEGRLDVALRFGPVNLICVSSTDQWDAWRVGTQRLLAVAPVTRQQAIHEFTELYRELTQQTGRFRVTLV